MLSEARQQYLLRVVAWASLLAISLVGGSTVAKAQEAGTQTFLCSALTPQTFDKVYQHMLTAMAIDFNRSWGSPNEVDLDGEIVTVGDIYAACIEKYGDKQRTYKSLLDACDRGESFNATLLNELNRDGKKCSAMFARESRKHLQEKQEAEPNPNASE